MSDLNRISVVPSTFRVINSAFRTPSYSLKNPLNIRVTVVFECS